MYRESTDAFSRRGLHSSYTACGLRTLKRNKWKNRKEVRGVGFGRERAGRGEVATGQLDVLEKAVRILHLRYRSCLRPLTPPFTCSSPTPLNPMPLPLLTCIPLTCVTHTPLPPHPHPTPPPLPSHAYPPTRAENGRGGGRSQLDSVELDVLEKAVRILHLRYRSCLRPLTKGRLPSVTELRELRVSAEALGVRSALLCLDRIPKGRLPSVTELRELRVSAEALGVRSALLCLDRIPKSSPALVPSSFPPSTPSPVLPAIPTLLHATPQLPPSHRATPVASPSLPSAHSPCAPSWTRRPLPPFPTAPHLPPLLPHPPSGRSPPTGSLCLPHIRPARRAGRGGPALAPNTPLLPPRPPPPLRPPSPGRPPSSRPLCLPHIRPARRAGRGGPSLPSPPLPTFPHSSPTPPPLLPHSSPTPPQGDPRRLALFAFRTFALRAELDAEALRDLDEPPPGNAWPVSSYRVGTPRLRALLEDMVEEVESLWNATNRTLYEVAIVLAPVLAQYALLGKAVGMAMEQYYARLTVRKHGRVVMAVGDEIILWDDGLEDVRELFLAEKAADEQPLGSAVRIDSMNDYSWFVSWNGTSAVDNIPSEVSVKKLLHSIGAPTARLAGLRARDKGLLMGVTVPDVRIEAEKRVLAQLQWVVDGGGKLEIKAARPQHQGISAGVGEREVIGRGKRAAGGGTGAAAGGGMDEPEPAHEIPYEDLVEATKNWSDDLQLGEGGSAPAHEIPYEDLVEATKNWSDDLQLGEGGSAVVYKGVSPDGELWAVKRGKKGGLTRLQDYHREVREWVLMGGAEIREDECGCVQGRGAGWGAELWAVKRGKKGGLTRLQDYHREIEAVSKMLHPNLVRLMGFCHENEEQVLVYEYVANGTLRQHLSPLQGDTEKGVLSFEQRIEAAVGVAEALLYLHSCKPVLVHRDVKSLNVFMDDDLQPKLGDYGNLKSIGDDESATTHTRVVGTPGYLDPQYCQTSVVSVRRVWGGGGKKEWGTPGYLDPQYCQTSVVSVWSDVYSFGVVMLELITAKPPVLKEAPLVLSLSSPPILSPLPHPPFAPYLSVSECFGVVMLELITAKPPFRSGHARAHHSQASSAQGGTLSTLSFLTPLSLSPSSSPLCPIPLSFGVVMLELITAKPPVLKEADDSGERMALAKWATPAICANNLAVVDPNEVTFESTQKPNSSTLSSVPLFPVLPVLSDPLLPFPNKQATPAICAGNLDAVVDPNLAQAFPQQPMQAFASLAAMCVQRQPKDRPSMQEVVRRLKPGDLAGTCVQRQPKDLQSSVFPLLLAPFLVSICLLPPTHQHAPQPINAANSSPQAWQPGLLAGQPAPHSAYVAAPSSISLTRLSSHSFPSASVSSPPPINTRPNPSMQRILPPKPGSRGSWRDNQHLTPPMSPLLPTTPEPSYSPRAAAAGGGGSGGMKVFNKEFWRPRRAPARSLRGAGGSVPVAAQAESSRGRMYGLGRKGKMVSAAALISVGGNQKEMAALAKLQHTNLAAILGYAADKEDMQIAYDLPPNCTCLENYLFP
ncbi:unnamed protein product, partial [Closterium sp. NIES-65]